MYEVGTSRDFEAWHVMPGAQGPEGTLHSHDYRLEVVVSCADLDARGMVCDLDLLEAAVDGALALIDGRDLESIRPADAEAVTVEVLARWLHSDLVARLEGCEGLAMSVRVWESPVAFGGYSAPATSSP